MSIHKLDDDCQWHDPPLAPDALTSERTCEWRGTCSCGWIGEWHAESTHVAADRARSDYREHIEASLGPAAYYTASVACRNCGSEHQQGVLMGTHVTSNPCVQCGTVMLNPRNAAWDESRAARSLWGPW